MKRLALLLATVSVICSAYGQKPIIGISSGLSKSTVKASDTYIIAVEKAGGIPLVIPLITSDRMAEEIISRLDGIVMTGGEDVNPAYYGEEAINDSVEVNFRRDSSDMRIIRTAQKLRKPMLGICRGMQIINVCMGGALYQDLPTQHPSSVRHRQKEAAVIDTHGVGLKKGSRLHAMLGDSIRVNSKHHQAVRKAGKHLKITGWAEDGIAETCEGKNITCVQFHPEAFIKNGDNKFLPIFEELVNNAKNNK